MLRPQELGFVNMRENCYLLHVYDDHGDYYLGLTLCPK